MTGAPIDTDYLIVGCGAAGMAFADVMIKESNARLVMVDRHQSPGGHWNDAYPFVRLHHPSHYYGVHSRPLGDLSVQHAGLNKGLLHMASGAEVASYYDKIMQQDLLPTGRVQYFPMSNYEGDGRFTSQLTGKSHQVKAGKRIVDATYSGTTVPSTHKPAYTIAPGLKCIPLNDLTRLSTPPAKYTVVGSGKTGMDACLWLLDQGVAPDSMRWIMPRDAWWMDRGRVQFTDAYFEASIANVASQMEALGQAATIDELFVGLEACGALLRLDKSIKPSMFHGATISVPEIEQLRRIKDIVRLGRVERIEPTQVVLQHGTIPADPAHLYVDCTASGFAIRPRKPVFEAGAITLQMLKSFQPSLSAALTGYVEAKYADDKTKNDMCKVVPTPKHATDWLPMMAVSMANQQRWSADPALMGWLMKSRLDPLPALMRNAPADDPAKMAALQRVRNAVRGAGGNIPKLMAQLPR